MTAYIDQLQAMFEYGQEIERQKQLAMADPLPPPGEDKPLTPEELKEKQKNQPGSSPRTPFPYKMAGGMPPDLNTPWLPGGQKTDGIPNIQNPKLKDVLKKKKGIKGSDPELFPLAQQPQQQLMTSWDQAMVDYGKPTPLDLLLKPAQDKYGPGLKGMPWQERKDLLIKGTKV